MNIYVAGTVLRQHLQTEVLEHLEDLYCCIETEAAGGGHTAQLPYPDRILDAMSPEPYQREIEKRIRTADSVITVLYPRNEAVAVEARLAATLRKPQAVLVDRADPPELPRGVDARFCHSVWDPPLKRIVAELAVAVARRNEEQEPPQMLTC